MLDIAITADSSKFASAGGDRTVFLWDVRTSKAVSRFTGHLAQVNSVKFSGNAQVLGSASFDGTVKLWDLRANNTTKPIQTLSDAKDSVSCLDIHEHRIFTASVDGRLRTYDLRKGCLTTDPVDDARAPLTSVTVLQDGEAALVSTLRSQIHLVDLHQSSAVPLQVFHGHKNEAYRLKPALADNDTLVLAPSEDGRVYVWDLMDETPVQTLDGQRAGSKGFALAAGSDRSWVSSTLDGSIVFW